MVSWKTIISFCLDSGLDLSIFYSKFYTNLHFSFIPSDFLCFYKVACSFWIIGCRKITVSLYYVWRIHNISRMVMLLWNLGGWWCWQMFYQYIFCLFFCLLTITDIRITGIIHYSYTSKAAQSSMINPFGFSAPSRRGDMEILAFCMLQWLCGKLPWEDKLLDKDYVANSKLK